MPTYRELIAQGLCPKCRKSNPATTVYCSLCLDKSSERKREVSPPPPKRSCQHCKADFQPERKGHRIRGRHSLYCSEKCHKAVKAEREKLRVMRMRYNLEEDELKELYGIQGGKCAICDDPIQLMAKKTHIDHDHESGQVRGILCLGCNLGLGHFRDDPQRLQKAITYLQ